jgi:hypothetical protein
VQINKGEEFLTPEILNKLIEGTFNVNIWPLIDAVSFKDIDYDENEGIPSSYVNFSDVLDVVSRYVREKTPGWFEEHIQVFREQTDGMFSMEYAEEEFAERLYVAIGYLGRNMRYRNDKEFWNLRYFIQRYISEVTRMLEMSFIHRCFTAFTGNEVEASYTRVEKHEAGLLLKSSELVISIVGLYHLITGWKGPESPFKLSDIRLYIPA